MTDITDNPLLSSRPSDTGLTVSLHPLVLLTVSDHVTRHSVRKQKGPIAGALLGQQKGREITAEYAFATDLVQNPEGQWRFNVSWMEERVQQYRDVHKAPALDFVGWYTLFPESGPSPAIVPLQRQAITFYNDSAILLALHPEAIVQANTTNGRLPVSIYEGVDEVEHQKDEASMQVDGEEPASSEIKFRLLPYTIETDETEMIAIDYVAKGAGSAAAVTETTLDTSAQAAPPPPPPPVEPIVDKKGKKRADTPSAGAVTTSETDQKSTNGASEIANPLVPEEEDQIASITTRLNSVKMLQTRISLLRQFIQSLPTSYLSDQTSSVAPDPSHLPHLRNIQALLTRLSLLTPASSSSAMQPLTSASQAQSNDVALASMLSLLGQDIQALSELGRKFATVESHRNSKAGKVGAAGGGGGGGPGSLGSKPGGVSSGYGGLDEGDGRFGGLAGLTGSGPGRPLLA